MSQAIPYLMFYGALLVPLAYFAIQRRSGRLWRLMFIGIAMQLCLLACVFGFVWFNWKAGYSESYYGYALLLPVNAFCLVYYCCSPLIAARRRNQTRRNLVDS